MSHNIELPPAARLCSAAVLVSSSTICFTYPQVIALSKNTLPKPIISNMYAVFKSTIMFQATLKTAQFGLMQELKNLLDQVTDAKDTNVMLAYGITGVPFQSVLYNRLISDIYRHHGIGGVSAARIPVPAVEAAKHFAMSKMYPGIAFAYVRECCATGGGLALAPRICTTLHELFPSLTDNRRTCSIASGITAGVFTGLCTQCVHNCALRAGAMADQGQVAGTIDTVRLTWREMGVSMIYTGFFRRSLLVASSTTCLSICDIF